MKQLENKTTAAETADGTIDLSYKGLAQECVRFNENSMGFTLEELSSRIRIEDAIKKSGEDPFIVLEDNDATVLKKLVKEMKWTVKSSSEDKEQWLIMAKFAEDFSKDVKKMQDYETIKEKV